MKPDEQDHCGWRKKSSENNLSTKWEVSKQEMVFIGSFRHAWHQKTMTFDFMPIYCFRYLLPLPTSFYAQVILLLVSLSSTNQCAGAKLDFQWPFHGLNGHGF